VAEWLKATVLKTVVPQGTVGSNPTLSALYGIAKNCRLHGVAKHCFATGSSPTPSARFMIEIKKLPTSRWEDYRDLRLESLKKDLRINGKFYDELILEKYL
jgi:hypothetical protein